MQEAATDSAVVRLAGVRKSFAGRVVLDRLDLAIERGRFYALVGQNGSGKSTLMRLLMKQEPPDEGRGSILGSPLGADDGALFARVGYVSETIEYVSPLPVERLFRVHARLYPRWDARRFDELLSVFAIPPSARFANLSRGQKVRISFAAALALQPELLLLDEVTAVLDAAARAEVLRRLDAFVEGGGTVVLATNIVSEVHHSADSMIFLDQGRIAFNQPVAELALRFQRLRKRRGADHAVFSLPGCVPVGINADDTLAYLVERSALAGVAVPDDALDPVRASPEDVFVFLTRRGGGA